MIRYLIKLIIFAVILSACNPYHFELNKYHRNKYRSIVENLSRYGAVEKYADNGFLIHKDASAAIKTPKVMQSLSDMTLRYKKDATGVFRVLFRASSERYKY